VVGVAADDEPVFALDVGERFVQLGVDEQHARTGVLDDVAHLFGDQAEVDRHQHATRPAHAEQIGEQTRRVLAHHRHALADPDAHRVEARGDRARPLCRPVRR
jgi:hypothetical protein